MRYPKIALALLFPASVLLAADLKSPDAPFLSRHSEKSEVKPLFSENGIQWGEKAMQWFSTDIIKYLNQEKNVFQIHVRATTSVPGWRPFLSFTNRANIQMKTMTGIHSFKLAENVQGTYSQSIKLLPDGRAKMTFLFGTPEKNRKDLKDSVLEFQFPKHIVSGWKIRFNQTDISIPEQKDWNPENKKNLWINMYSSRETKKIIFDAEHSDQQFSLEAEGSHFVLFRSANMLQLRLYAIAANEPISFIFDPGKSMTSAAKDNIVAGINFTRNNDFTVPVFNPAGNLLMNPSFESGSRYFKTYQGRNTDLDQMLSKDARSGKYSLRLEFPVETFGVPIQANSPHTFSFYAKASGAVPQRLQLTATSYSWSRVNKIFTVKPGEWQRFELPFSIDRRIVKFTFSGKEILLDDLQLEAASKATAYAGNRFGLELITDSPEGNTANRGSRINARLLLRGPAGSKGTISFHITDFFNRETAKETLPFTLGTNGESIVSLGPDSRFPLGTSAVKVTVRPEKQKEFIDFLRISHFPYANNTAKNKNIHATAWFGHHISIPRVPDETIRRLQIAGIGAHVYLASQTDHHTVDLTEATAKRLKSFGMDLFSNYIPYRKWYSDGKRYDTINEERLQWNGIDFINMDSYPPDFLTHVENLVYKEAKAHPHILYWTSHTEPQGGVKTLKQNNPEEYAKFLLAVNRGLMKANPKIVYNPLGACNMSDTGRKDVLSVLAACRKLEPKTDFKNIDIHTYRPFPEQPDVETDLLLFLDGLKKLDYEKIPVHLGEGAYFYPMIVSQWLDISPWASTQVKDQFFSCGVPTYDLGWGERVGAAMTLRYWLICYKYMNRVKVATPWSPLLLDNKHPFAWLAMSAVLTDLLGNSEFHKDIRFYPGARGLVFEDQEKRSIAAVWHFEEELDRGLKKGLEMSLNLKGLNPEFIDMMGNNCTVERKNGFAVLPLSNFPFYIRVAPDQQQTLVKALETAKVSGARFPLNFSARIISPDQLILNALNPLSAPVSAKISVADGPIQTLQVPSMKNVELPIKLKQNISPERIEKISIPLSLSSGGETSSMKFSMDVLGIRRVTEPFNWNSIPAIPFRFKRPEPNIAIASTTKDFSGTWQCAWNEKNFHIRILVNDDTFVMNHTKNDPMFWYDNDAVQIFIDTFGDAKEKAARGRLGFDENDYSYELLPTSRTSAIVYRRHAPDHQFTGGAADGLKASTVEPGVKCSFRVENGKQIYEAVFPARYLQPMILKTGRSPAIGIKIYDRDTFTGPAKQTLSNCEIDPFQRPDGYTTLLFLD